MADEKPKPPPNPFQEPYQPFGKKSISADKPIVAPDGHENLSQEDIDARDGG